MTFHACRIKPLFLKIYVLNVQVIILWYFGWLFRHLVTTAEPQREAQQVMHISFTSRLSEIVYVSDCLACSMLFVLSKCIILFTGDKRELRKVWNQPETTHGKSQQVLHDSDYPLQIMVAAHIFFYDNITTLFLPLMNTCSAYQYNLSVMISTLYEILHYLLHVWNQQKIVCHVRLN